MPPTPLCGWFDSWVRRLGTGRFRWPPHSTHPPRRHSPLPAALRLDRGLAGVACTTHPLTVGGRVDVGRIPSCCGGVSPADDVVGDLGGFGAPMPPELADPVAGEDTAGDPFRESPPPGPPVLVPSGCHRVQASGRG